jgi:hypothetical protein
MASTPEYGLDHAFAVTIPIISRAGLLDARRCRGG